LNTLKLPIEERELQQRNARFDSSAIPSREILDRIHRYETANVRHRYKVEARLERLQAQRKENEKAMGQPAAMMKADRISKFCETKPINVLFSTFGLTVFLPACSWLWRSRYQGVGMRK